MASVSEQVEAVARALCALDGKDPSERMRRPGEGAGFLGHLRGTASCLWEGYVGEAERFVVAIEAMQPFLDRAKRW